MDYPQDRPKFFANHVIRLMQKTAAANEIGVDACWLVTVVAMLEDAPANRYTRPVTFWTSQTLSATGFSSWRRLDRARKAAVKAGWLFYIKGTKTSPAQYWVGVPEPLDLEEIELRSAVSSNEDKTANRHTKADKPADQHTNARSMRDQNGYNSNLLPVPLSGNSLSQRARDEFQQAGQINLPADSSPELAEMLRRFEQISIECHGKFSPSAVELSLMELDREGHSPEKILKIVTECCMKQAKSIRADILDPYPKRNGNGKPGPKPHCERTEDDYFPSR